jgi:hypothetical protein
VRNLPIPRSLLLLPLVFFLACQSRERREEPATTTSDAWTVSVDGYGPIHAGMSLAEAGRASGRALGEGQLGSSECDYVFFADDSSGGVHFMVIEDTIARVDILDSAVTTSHGVKIGDTEEVVQSRYPGRVTVQPHKYTDGHYLVVAPGDGADSGGRIIFETEGGRVTTFRAGRMPEVEYVEGCS